MTKYEIDSSETHFQQGSNNTVLANKLGIIDPAEMDEAELILLKKLYEKVFSENGCGLENLALINIVDWHRQWLGNIYDWAGKIRNIDMGKGGFQFASARQLGPCIDLFEKDYLSKFPTIPEMNLTELVQYLARSHIEFILIHPFREGNGRISRLLMDTMCNTAGIGILDYSLWDENKDYYIRSIQAGLAHDYKYMERLVRDIVIS